MLQISNIVIEVQLYLLLAVGQQQQAPTSTVVLLVLHGTPACMHVVGPKVWFSRLTSRCRPQAWAVPDQQSQEVQSKKQDGHDSSQHHDLQACQPDRRRWKRPWKLMIPGSKYRSKAHPRFPWHQQMHYQLWMDCTLVIEKEREKVNYTWVMAVRVLAWWGVHFLCTKQSSSKEQHCHWSCKLHGVVGFNNYNKTYQQG